MKLNVQVPQEQQVGAYANELVVWHTNQDFTLDFCQSQSSDDPEVRNLVVAARIKIPPTLVFEVLKALNTNLGKYEATFGDIKRPGGTPEDDTP